MTTDDSTSPTRRERKKQETRRALEDAALRLFAERGYEQTTVEDIADEADVAVRTFFRYFATKQDVLFGDVVTDRVERMKTALAGRPPDEHPLDSIRIVMDLLDFNTPDEEEQILARLELMRAQPSFVSRYLEIMDQMRQTIVDFVVERTGMDPSKDLYPMLIGGACVASWDSSLKVWVLSGRKTPLRDLRKQAFDALSSGLSSLA